MSTISHQQAPSVCNIESVQGNKAATDHPTLRPDYETIVQQWDEHPEFRESSYSMLLEVSLFGDDHTQMAQYYGLPKTIIYRTQLMIDIVLSRYRVSIEYAYFVRKVCLFIVMSRSELDLSRFSCNCSYVPIIIAIVMSRNLWL